MTSSPPLDVDDLSFSDLDLITSPPARAAAAAAAAPGGPSPSVNKSTSSNKPLTTRPSFKPGAASAVAPPAARRPSTHSSQQANLRLLQGVSKPPPTTSSNRAAAGTGPGNKRRISLFVPSALPKANSSFEDADESAAVNQGEGDAEGDDSLMAAIGTTKHRGPALPSLPASFHQQRPTRGGNNVSGADEGEGATADQGGESETKEQVQRQLEDLSKMNSSFEAYERMLQGTVGQIDLFSNRLEGTSTLLSSYIDLLRRSSNHQNLLLDPSWQGQTVDKIQHAEAMRELEEQMEKRRRQREEEEERQEQQRLRIEQEREEQEYRKSIVGAGRGGRGGGGGARGRITTTGLAGRGGSAASSATRGRGTAPLASTRGRGGIAAGRPSAIPAPTAAARGGARSSTRGRGAPAAK